MNRNYKLFFTALITISLSDIVQSMEGPGGLKRILNLDDPPIESTNSVSKHYKAFHSHSQSITCKISTCGKTFTNTSRLKHHMHCHDMGRQFTCKNCTLGFEKYETLVDHHHRSHKYEPIPQKNDFPQAFPIVRRTSVSAICAEQRALQNKLPILTFRSDFMPLEDIGIDLKK